MREIRTHEINPFNLTHVGVTAMDGAGPGGASHEYRIDLLCPPKGTAENPDDLSLTGERTTFTLVFQNGPIKRSGYQWRL